MNISIKKAQLKDIETLSRIHSTSLIAAFGGLFPEEIVMQFFGFERRLKGFAKELEKGQPVNFLVYDEDEAIGILSYGPSRHMEVDDDTIEIWRVYFLPGYWGRGAAAIAMDLIMKKIQEAGYKKVILWVMEENLRARRFYEKSGFEKTMKIHDDELGRPTREIMYELALKPKESV